jgi:hypothetical protein
MKEWLDVGNHLTILRPMRGRLRVVLLGLLLIAVSYSQVFDKITTERGIEVLYSNADTEEPVKKSTSEENIREIDQDDGPITYGLAHLKSDASALDISKNGNYSFGHLGYYPEIVAPPPQG